MKKKLLIIVSAVCVLAAFAVAAIAFCKHKKAV